MPLLRKDEVVWLEWEFYSVGTPYKRQLRILGVKEIQKRAVKQAILLAVGRLCTEHWGLQEEHCKS